MGFTEALFSQLRAGEKDLDDTKELFFRECMPINADTDTGIELCTKMIEGEGIYEAFKEHKSYRDLMWIAYINRANFYVRKKAYEKAVQER